jgi:hypothetical protein
MRKLQAAAGSALFGSRDHTSVSRRLSEFHGRRRPVLIGATDGSVLALQDDGFDTIDANTMLGFDDDERDCGVAAQMLRMLNCTRIVLLTNNPAKLDGLARAGIEIVGRMPLDALINADNRRYMTARAERSGHRLDHLSTLLAGRS